MYISSCVHRKKSCFKARECKDHQASIIRYVFLELWNVCIVIGLSQGICF